MNKQPIYGNSYKNKKNFNSPYQVKQSKKKKSSTKKKKSTTNRYNNHNNRLYESYGNNEKNINKMMREYQQFVRQYFGESTPISCLTEEKMNKFLEDQNNEKKLLEEKNNIEFQKFLKNNNDLDFGNEDICIELPEEEEITYSQNDMLGNNKNNKNDYARRKKLLFKEEKENEEKKNEIIQETQEKIINEIDNEIEKENENENEGYDDFDEKIEDDKQIETAKENNEKQEKIDIVEEKNDIVEEEKNNNVEEKIDVVEEKKEDVEEKNDNEEVKNDNEEIKNDNEEDKNNNEEDKNTTQIEEDPNAAEKNLFRKEKEEESARIIQKIFRQKRSKVKLYIGYDSSEYIILRIYAKDFDKNKKIRSIEIYGFSMLQKKTIYLEKNIKDLLGIDSISEKGIKKIMGEIIEKVLLQNDETINLDELSELQGEKENENDGEDNKNLDSKKKYNGEEIINQIENGKESVKDFVIENNEEKIKEDNADKNEVNKSLSSIDDVDYKF